jgi:hypothetical protein
MKRKIMCRVVATAMVVSATGVLASPAWASKGIHNFGGYAAPVVATVSGTITVPAADSISCASTKAINVDLWVALTRGQYAANAGLVVKCTGGSPLTYISGDAGTVSFRFPVSAGDVVNVTTSESASGTSVTADDTTSTVNDTANYVGVTAPTAMIAQIGATSTSKSIPNFGPTTFSNIMVDGTQLAASSATQRNLSRSHPPGAIPGPLAGGAFTLTET